MKLWQQAFGTRAEPRRVSSPGLVAALVLVAVLWAGLGVWALADGDLVGSLLRLLFAAFWLAFAVYARRQKPHGDAVPVRDSSARR